MNEHQIAAGENAMKLVMRGIWRAGYCAAALAVCACAASADGLERLYEQTKTEKSLVLYAGGPAAPHERYAREFEQRFPGLTVSVTGGFSNILNQKIEEQIKRGRLEVDMALFQTVQDFVNWKKRGLLLPFKPEGFDQIHPSFRDEDGAYIAMRVNAITYAYNTKLLRAEDVPQSAFDFLKPVFHGKLIAVYPADDDAALYLFYTIVQKYGWSYMDKYMANKPNFVQGHLNVARSVAAGDNIATLDATSTVWGLKRAGQPIEALFSPVDETPVFTSSAGIFKDAPHPNAAKLYLSWYLAKEQQSRLDTFSPRNDVPPPAGMKPLFSYKLANGYRDFMIDEAKVLELRNRFERYTGPVVNRGGVR
jgi:ABC-type Fe3+ transport system substrate-binding protein